MWVVGDDEKTARRRDGHDSLRETVLIKRSRRGTGADSNDFCVRAVSRTKTGKTCDHNLWKGARMEAKDERQRDGDV